MIHPLDELIGILKEEIEVLSKERDEFFRTSTGPGGEMQLEIDALKKERDEAKEQTTQMRLACEDYPKMVDQLLKERDDYREVLEKIGNQQLISLDKVDLILKCEGHIEIAEEILAKYPRESV